MNPKTAAVLALFFVVATLTLRDVLASQPPPEQVEEAAEAAKLMPDEWPPCKWVTERSCVTPAQWERMVEDVVEE